MASFQAAALKRWRRACISVKNSIIIEGSNFAGDAKVHFDSWITYVIAYAVISIVPGPSVLMIIGQALSRGKRAAIACIFGGLLGGIFVMTASYLGLGLILASSALAFAVMKWVGVAYMAYLGLSQIIAARKNLGNIIAYPVFYARHSWRSSSIQPPLSSHNF
ncbi:LysE family translocator [Phaeobacter inhibens]|uniref:LysE family translocator n=1 Tax=Phaeobacter inhibens TaxID=221822 RepID=UPI00295E6449|nr:LysE family translocator [Phaeobacter inhibens]